MVEQPPTPNLDTESTAGTPRWVKVFGIIALVVIVLFVILMFTKGPGGHGPRRHMRTGAETPAASVTEVPTPPERERR